MTDLDNASPHSLPDSGDATGTGPDGNTPPKSTPSVIRDVVGFFVMLLVMQMAAGVVIGFYAGFTAVASGKADQSTGFEFGPYELQSVALLSFVFVGLWIWRVIRQQRHKLTASRFLQPVPSMFDLVFFVIIGTVATLCLQVGINLFLTEVLGLNAVEDTNPLRNLPEGGLTTLFVALMVLNVVILAPVFEELLFRGLIFHRLQDKYSPTTAMIISAALFALIHFDLKVFPALFTLGFIAAYAVHRTGSIMPAIGMHLLNNMIAISLTLVAAGAPET